MVCKILKCQLLDKHGHFNASSLSLQCSCVGWKFQWKDPAFWGAMRISWKALQEGKHIIMLLDEWFVLIVLSLKTLEWGIPHTAGWGDWIGHLRFKCHFVMLRTWYEGKKRQNDWRGLFLALQTMELVHNYIHRQRCECIERQMTCHYREGRYKL